MGCFVRKDKIEEVVSLCEAIRRNHGLDQYAANRAGGLLLFVRMSNHEYAEAETIAKKLYERANMPYQTLYVLADFYMKTRRYTIAQECIRRMILECSDDPGAEKWIAKIQEELQKRIKSGKYYKPMDEANQIKLSSFLKSKQLNEKE